MQIFKHAGDVATEISSEDSYQSPTSNFPTLYIFTSILQRFNHQSLANMEKTHTKSALKFMKASSQSALSWSSTSRGMTKDELKDRLFGKSKASQKSPPRENTKPQDFKLHTQERAIKRAMFNYEVATKLFVIEQQKKQAERLQKMIEEEEVRLLRKEMIPRAQLMPFFDRPFFPQRSSRPLTVPREPSFRMRSGKCGGCNISCNGLYTFQGSHGGLNAIK